MSKKNFLWTVEMRAFAVEKYLETISFDAAIRDFVTKFNPPKPPYKSLIVKWVAKFRTEGTVRNLNSINPGRKSHSGRKRKRNEEFIERLRESVQVTSQIDEEEVSGAGFLTLYDVESYQRRPQLVCLSY